MMKMYIISFLIIVTFVELYANVNANVNVNVNSIDSEIPLVSRVVFL